MGTVTASQDVITDLLANPANYYVNVHTAEFPGGALRRQLGPIPQPTATFVTALSGSGEAPANGSGGTPGPTAGTAVTTNAYLVVVSDGPVFPYVTVIDNQSGDSVFLPASDDEPEP